VDQDSDLTITCVQCGSEFIFTQAEQEFYRQKGFSRPQRCKQCRLTRNASRSPMICSRCGNKLGNGAPVYCSTCLEDVQLEFELKTRGLETKINQAETMLSVAETEKAKMGAEMDAKLSVLESEKNQLVNETEAKIGEVESEKTRLVDEMNARLSIIESEKNRFDGLLNQKNKSLVELQEQLNDANLELLEAQKHRVALEWLEPTLNNIQEELRALEQDQKRTREIMFRLGQRIEEFAADGSLVNIIRRFFRPHRNLPASS
jgi:hypothetical protein